MNRSIAFFLALILLLPSACAFAEIDPQEVMGAVENGDYKNEHFGFGFHCGEWQVMSEEEMASVYDKAYDISEEFAKEMERRDSLYFFRASGPENKDQALGVVTDIGVAAAGLYQLLGVGNMQRMQDWKLRGNLESYGIDVDAVSYGSITVDGREMACMRVLETFDGMSVYTIEVSVIKRQYRIDLGASSTAGFDAAEAIMARFFWL
jgi:hypothetical protein